MNLPFPLILLIAFSAAQTTHKLPPNQANDIKTVAKQGLGTDQGRAAWRRLSKGGPELLPHLLKAMDTSDIVTCNWLRTAFERILEHEIKAEKKIDVEPLYAFAKNPKHQGRARRFALSIVERLQPGITKQFLKGKLNDPEFRFDAVDLLLEKAKRLAKRGERQEAIAAYQRALDSTRDVPQAQRAAAALLDFGIEKSVARHFGFLTDWYLVGPFDAPNKKGFSTVYPPEKKVDLKATYKGQSNKIHWKRYRVQEPSPKIRAKHVALVNLREARALGDADDAVAFAYTEINVPKARKVEFRGSADDNFTVWVNGKKVFAFEEYNNGVRLDRHRFPVQLKKGKNTILVKIVQSPPYIAPNWEFFLRLADDTGKGVPFENALPKVKP